MIDHNKTKKLKKVFKIENGFLQLQNALIQVKL